MSNTIAWIILVAAALVSAVALTAVTLWTVWENDRKKAAIKLICTAVLFVAVILLMGYMATIVHL
jgi:hypothetical protein